MVPPGLSSAAQGALRHAVGQLAQLLGVERCAIVLAEDGQGQLEPAEGLRACWSVPLVAGGSTLGSLAIYHPEPCEPAQEQLEAMRTLASIVALGLDGLRRQQALAAGQQATIQALTSALDARDAYTQEHSAATSGLAVAVARRLGLTDAALDHVERVALLHDVGKIAIPNEILSSPEPLDADQQAVMRTQQAVMRTHPEVGERILRHVPEFDAIATAVRHEHERWDGGGYPDGLAGVQIPPASRIVFACDAYHAMTSDRPYRGAISREAAVAELRAHAGTQFDPVVVGALLDVLDAGAEAGVEAVAPAVAEERARDDALAAIAHDVGCDDVLVFRRVAGQQFSHVGGIGRGRGWAGNIELDARTEPHLLAAVEAGRCHCVTLPESGRIVGPYFGGSAMITPCGPDAVVVFGAADGRLGGTCTRETGELARRVAAMLDEVPAAKRLADELEVLDAVRAVTTVTADTVRATLHALAARAAEALSCEFAALVLHDEQGARVGWVDRGWRPAGDALDAGLIALARGLDDRPLLVQEPLEARRALAITGDAAGAAAVHAIPVGSPAVATLLVVHAQPVMRGFTSLCQRVAAAMAEAGAPVLRRALTQERLARENAALSLRVRTDALTGVASRSAWEELVMAEELHRARSASAVSVAVFDVDGLKRVNDHAGHGAGDQLLRTCAQVLLDTSRATDFVARLGGDEFVVLLRYCDASAAASWIARVEAELCARGAAMTGGWAETGPDTTIADAYAIADKRLLAAKAAGGARRPC